MWTIHYNSIGICAVGFLLNLKVTRILSVADPGFSRRLCANSQKCYYFSIFLPKTACKWKNLDTQGVGGARPWCPPWIRKCLSLLKGKKEKNHLSLLYSVSTSCTVNFRLKKTSSSRSTELYLPSVFGCRLPRTSLAFPLAMGVPTDAVFAW